MSKNSFISRRIFIMGFVNTFIGFFGWPNFTAQHDGGFMGLPKSSNNIDFKVIDIYRRGENKLAENWVFIDILSIFYQQDVDILDRNRMIQKG